MTEEYQSIMTIYQINLDFIVYLNEAIKKYCKNKGLESPLVEKGKVGMMEVLVKPINS